MFNAKPFNVEHLTPQAALPHTAAYGGRVRDGSQPQAVWFFIMEQVNVSRVVMFDFDGVVADSLEVFYAEFSAAVRELGYTKLDSREALLKLFEGNVIANLIKAGFPIWRLKKLGQQFAPRIAEASSRVVPFDGMPELVGRIAQHYPTYVITSNTTATVESFLVRYKVEGVLDVMGADKEASKVKKIKAVRKLHPQHAPWYIGDTKGDMLEAKAAGAVSVAAAWGWHDVATLSAAKPKHMVHKPEELSALLLEDVQEALA